MLRTKLLLILPMVVTVTVGQTDRGIGYYGTSNVRDQRPQPDYGARPLPGRPMPWTSPAISAAQPAPAPSVTAAPVAPPAPAAPAAPSYAPVYYARPPLNYRPVLPPRPIRPIMTVPPPAPTPAQPPVVVASQPPAVEASQPPAMETPQPPAVEVPQPQAPEVPQPPAVEAPQPTVVAVPQRPLAVAPQPPAVGVPQPLVVPALPPIIPDASPIPEVESPQPPVVVAPEPPVEAIAQESPEPTAPQQSSEIPESPELITPPQPLPAIVPVQPPVAIPQPASVIAATEAPVPEPSIIAGPESPVVSIPQEEPISREPPLVAAPQLPPQEIPEAISIENSHPASAPGLPSVPEAIKPPADVEPEPVWQPAPEPAQEIELTPERDPALKPIPVHDIAPAAIIPVASMNVALPPLLPKPQPIRQPAFGRHPRPSTPTINYPTPPPPPPTPSYVLPTVVTQVPPVVITTSPHPSPPVTRQPGFLRNDFDCREGNGYYSVENECDAYIECKQDKAMKRWCPDGLHFNPTARHLYEYPCAYPSEVQCMAGAAKQSPQPTDHCPNQYGFYPMFDGDCSKFIMCQEGLATIMNCPVGLAFNPQKSSCDWPANVPQCNPDVFKDFTCPAPPQDEDGQISEIIYKYRYGGQCKLYIACQLGHPRLLSCERGLSFDEASQSCIDEDYVTNCAVPYTVVY